MRLEYCIFRDRKLNGEEFVETDVKEEQIGSIPANSTKTIRSSTGLSFKANNFLNEAAGIRVRIYSEPQSKSSLTREQCFPEDLEKEVYVWKKEETETTSQKQVSAQNHTPLDFSSVNMSKDDVKALIKTYAEAWEDEDFEQWEILLSDLHPNHRYFDEKIFKNRSIKSYTIKDIDGLKVRVKVTLKNGFDRPEWFYLHESGRIKYTPDLFEHPTADAIDSIRLLYSREWESTGISQLKEAGVPLFGYHGNLSESKKQKSIKQIYEWLEDNGLSLDNSEPKVFLAEEHFKTLMKRAKSTISYANFTED